MDNVQTTAEDRAWFAEEVDIQIEQDNIAWLDSMMQMKQLELINYATFNYGIPQVAAEAVNRNDLIRLIVVANKAGGGQSVSNTEYIYIKELKGIIEPAVSLFLPDDDPLYMVRGEGNSKQVYDKVTNTWQNLALLKKQHEATIAQERSTAAQAADIVASHPSFNQPPAPQAFAPAPPAVPALPTLSPAVISVVETGALKRKELEAFGAELNIEGIDNIEIFETNQSIKDKIVEVNEANKETNLAQGV